MEGGHELGKVTFAFAGVAGLGYLYSMPQQQSPSRAFAQVHGSPGERARLAGVVVAIWPLLVATALAGYLVRAAFPVPVLSSPVAGALILGLAAVFAATLSAMQRRLGSFLKGAHGEERVAHELAFLPAGYDVFHGIASAGQTLVPQGGADYDHVVAGPNGLFVVETKNWRDPVTIEEGRILYDGCEPTRAPIDQVKRAAHALERAIAQATGHTLTIHPVLCFAGDAFRLPPQGVMGAIACNARDVVAVITGDFETPLDAPVVAELVTALKRTLKG